ncbi:hypothetical protein HK405_012885, partial [Cladochytrium tenue]
HATGQHGNLNWRGKRSHYGVGPAAVGVGTDNFGAGSQLQRCCSNSYVGDARECNVRGPIHVRRGSP